MLIDITYTHKLNFLIKTLICVKTLRNCEVMLMLYAITAVPQFAKDCVVSKSAAHYTIVDLLVNTDFIALTIQFGNN